MVCLLKLKLSNLFAFFFKYLFHVIHRVNTYKIQIVLLATIRRILEIDKNIDISIVICNTYAFDLTKDLRHFSIWQVRLARFKEKCFLNFVFRDTSTAVQPKFNFFYKRSEFDNDFSESKYMNILFKCL